jgi:hypothetical protein
MAGFNLGSLFTNTPRVQVANQPAPQGPQQPTGKPGSSLEAPGTGQQQPGQTGQQTPQNQEANSPLDAFKTMWQDDPTKQASNADPFASPLFNMDQGKVNEAIGQIDFVQQLNPELVQKAMSGQDPQAFMQVINEVGRKALLTSVQLSTATAEQAGQKIGQRFNTALPGRFKDLQIQSQAPSNPLLSNPSVAPMLDAVRQRLKMQNPDWTPAQIQQQAEKYFSDFAAELQNSDPKMADQRKAQQASSQEFNWDEWATKSPQSSF